jgi:hypothetical protein
MLGRAFHLQHRAEYIGHILRVARCVEMRPAAAAAAAGAPAKKKKVDSINVIFGFGSGRSMS